MIEDLLELYGGPLVCGAIVLVTLSAIFLF